ncbi:17577_t:CDS:2 [Acaulospora morrowiae]|uniref:17577_t:CDS:1 n=1 Tax=Acaulospora morrowiae TaxID=94023 RepID=A0A9N9EYP1_9GLOM|nr:17577_t:CDS:2 [Acaulospora morrowiae]
MSDNKNLRYITECGSENRDPFANISLGGSDDLDTATPTSAFNIHSEKERSSVDSKSENDTIILSSFQISSENRLQEKSPEESNNKPIIITQASIKINDVDQTENVDMPDVQMKNIDMHDIIQISEDNEIKEFATFTGTAGICNSERLESENTLIQSKTVDIKLSYLTEALKKCEEVKSKTKELLQRASEKDDPTVKLDLVTKAQINKMFVDLRCANRKANMRIKENRAFRMEARDVFDDAWYKLLEVKYKKFLLDYDLKVIKFKESIHHKISLIPVEEFFSTASNEFTDPLFKYQNITSPEQQQYEHDLFLQRLKYEKCEREMLEDEKIRKLGRKCDLECTIKEKLDLACRLDHSLKECIRKTNLCRSLREAQKSLSSSFSLSLINNNDNNGMNVDYKSSFDKKTHDLGNCTNSDKEEGELIQ